MLLLLVFCSDDDDYYLMEASHDAEGSVKVTSSKLSLFSVGSTHEGMPPSSFVASQPSPHPPPPPTACIIPKTPPHLCFTCRFQHSMLILLSAWPPSKCAPPRTTRTHPGLTRHRQGGRNRSQGRGHGGADGAQRSTFQKVQRRRRRRCPRTGRPALPAPPISRSPPAGVSLGSGCGIALETRRWGWWWW